MEDQHKEQSRAEQLPGLVAAACSQAKGVYIAFLALVFFAVFFVIEADDLALVKNEGLVSVPVLNVQVKPRPFFKVIPIILIVFYTYMNLYLLRLWKLMAEPRKEGLRLSDLSPWIFVQEYESTPHRMIAVATHVMLLPTSLAFFSIRYARAHDVDNLWSLANPLIGAIVVLCCWVAKAWLTNGGSATRPVLPAGWRFTASWMLLHVVTWATWGVHYSSFVAAGFRGERQDYLGLGWIARNYADLNHRIICTPDQLELPVYSCDLHDAHLEGADLSGSVLFRANLRNAFLTNTDLTEADLRQADLESSHLDGAVLLSANLACASLKTAIITDAVFAFAHMPEADLSGAHGSRVSFKLTFMPKSWLGDVNITDSSGTRAIPTFEDAIDEVEYGFAAAWLSGSSFYGAKLRNTSFRGARMEAASFPKPSFQNVDFSRAVLDGSLWWCEEGRQLDIKWDNVETSHMYLLNDEYRCQGSAWNDSQTHTNNDKARVSHLIELEREALSSDPLGKDGLAYLKHKGLPTYSIWETAEGQEILGGFRVESTEYGHCSHWRGKMLDVTPE